MNIVLMMLGGQKIVLCRNCAFFLGRLHNNFKFFKLGALEQVNMPNIVHEFLVEICDTLGGLLTYM